MSGAPPRNQSPVSIVQCQSAFVHCRTQKGYDQTLTYYSADGYPVVASAAIMRNLC